MNNTYLVVECGTHRELFTFDTYEEFEEWYQENNELDVLISYEAGDHLKQLADEVGLYPENIEDWINYMEGLDEHEAASAYPHAENGELIQDLNKLANDNYAFQGDSEEYAEQLTNDCYDIPEFLKFYVNYEKMGYDMQSSGEIYEFEYNGKDYVTQRY